MLKYKLLIVFVLICFFTACNHNNNKNDASFTANNEINENITDFLKLFYSDSTFQMSRIVFPLESDDTNASDDEMETHSYNKENWIMLRNSYFKENDSVAVIGGEVFKRRVIKSEKYYEESVFIEDSGFFVTMKFRLVDTNWYLVDYIESFN